MVFWPISGLTAILRAEILNLGDDHMCPVDRLARFAEMSFSSGQYMEWASPGRASLLRRAKIYELYYWLNIYLIDGLNGIESTMDTKWILN